MIEFTDWSIYSFDNIVMLAPLSRKLDVKYVGLIKVNVLRIYAIILLDGIDSIVFMYGIVLLCFITGMDGYR